MDTEKIGQFISELRKSRQMTQKELALKLNVSDKAVSKWERGLSCPDISLLSPLADILGVTTTELLNGARAGSESIDVEAIVDSALEYGEKTVNRTADLNQSIIAAVFSGLLLIGVFVTALVDVVTSGAFTWSLIVVSASAFTWLIFFPAVKLTKMRIVAPLVAFTVFIVPFLYVLDIAIDRLIGSDTMLFPMGIRIAPLSIVFFWIAYLLFKKLKSRKLLAAAILVFLSGLISYATNTMIANMQNQPYDGVDMVLNTFPPVIAAAILFIIEFVLRKSASYKS